MQRTIDIEVSLNSLQVQNKPLFCEGDKNTHFLKINFMNDLDLAGYSLEVKYLPPYPAVIPLVDIFRQITSNPFIVPISNELLDRNGIVKVEFSLSKGSELITINKTFDFEVKKTLNGTCLTAYPTGELKLTIAQQIEKIKALLADTDTKIAEYNDNVTEKTQTFNDNSTKKLKAYNDNDVSKTNTYNQNAEEKLSTYNENDKLKKEEYDNNATEKLGAYNSNDTSKTTAFNENAKKKTTEFDAHIKQTTDSTYLEMDKKATEYANAAGERANLKVKEQENLSVQTITNEGTKQIGLVENKGTEEIGKIQIAGTQAVGDVNANKDAHLKAVTDEGNKQVLAVGTKGVEEVEKVQAAGTQAVGDVNANKTANIQAVTEEGTKQVELVGTEGSKQVQAITSKGEEQTRLVTTEGEKQIGLIGTKGTEETGKVGSEGSKQVLAVKNQGSISIESLLKIQKEIEAILKNQEAIGNALALNGKSGPQYDKEIQSIAGGNFDPNLLYLNDEGTKEVGKLYYDRLKSGVFKCIKQTTSTVNSTEFFVDVSSLQNANRLDNLKGYRRISIPLGQPNIEQEVYDFSKLFTPDNFPCIEVTVFVHGKTSGWVGVKCVKFATYTRPQERVNTIYDNGITNLTIRLDPSTKKLFVTPVRENFVCDIFLLEYTPNISY